MFLIYRRQRQTLFLPETCNAQSYKDIALINRILVNLYFMRPECYKNDGILASIETGSVCLFVNVHVNIFHNTNIIETNMPFPGSTQHAMMYIAGTLV